MQILLFSLLAAGATILGGGLPLLHRRLSERHLTLLVAFSAGVLLSTGLNHMIPESYSVSGRWAMFAISAGFILLYGYEKVSMVHACREQDCKVHRFGPSALVGMGFHSFLDGFAIAVSFVFEESLGIIVIAAVILHRFPTGVSIACLLLGHDYREGRAWTILIVLASLALVGATTGAFMPAHDPFYLSLAVGISGGTFLYISTSDLLPMAHQNTQDYKVPALFLLGFFCVLAATLLDA